MMDEDTITIAYRDWRGEPRGRGKKREDLGDCIDCNACVAVCPMGIDIRDGQQMECITCGLCIDACDEMMVKVGKERGLIDYLALERRGRTSAPATQKVPVTKHLFRPRTILYVSLWALVGVGLTVARVRASGKVDVTVRPVRNPTYVTLSDGAIRNTYDVGVRNRHGEEWPYYFALTARQPDLKIELEGSRQAGGGRSTPDTEAKQRVYVIAPRAARKRPS